MPPKDAEMVEAVETNEPWTVYKLQDGSVLKLKTVATEIWRVIDEFDAEGNPQYVVKSGLVMNVQAPDKLKKPN